MKILVKAWMDGREIIIYESMINYRGRAVTFIQFIPEKPINHGLKVFVVAFAYNVIIIVLERHVGSKLGTRDNYSLSLYDRLINAVGLTNERIQVFYTKNWYTSMDIAKHMWVNNK